MEMKISKSLVGLMLLMAMSGCSGIQDSLNERCNILHNELTAMEAWARWSWCYNELTHPKDFAAGFRAGYQDILNGGAGCQPTLPPKEYWKPCYRNAEGNCRVNAWFEGFSHGVLAANKDGAASYGHIPLSPTAQGNWDTACQEPHEYDWSAAETPPAPLPSDAADYAPVRPGELPEIPTTPNGTAPAVPPIRNYEEDAKPMIDPPVKTTSGRISLPNLGG